MENIKVTRERYEIVYGWTVRADTKRYGKNEIMYEGSYEGCFKYLEKLFKNPSREEYEVTINGKRDDGVTFTDYHMKVYRNGCTKRERLYKIMFDKHRDCTLYFYEYYCFAANAKEAIELAKTEWSKNDEAFQFHIMAKRNGVQNPVNLIVKDWCGREITGETAMNRFIVVESRTWRINGKNVFHR